MLRSFVKHAPEFFLVCFFCIIFCMINSHLSQQFDEKQWWQKQTEVAKEAIYMSGSTIDCCIANSRKSFPSFNITVYFIFDVSLFFPSMF